MHARALFVLLIAVALGGAAPARALAQEASVPTIFEVAPTRVYNDAASEITIIGVGFVATPIVTLSSMHQRPVVLFDARLATSTILKATVPAGTLEGIYTVYVYNPDGGRSEAAPQPITVVRPGDERMSTWAQTTPLDAGRNNFAMVAAAGNLYVLGGFSGPGGMSQRTVQRAPIAADGALGAWQSTSQLITARGDFAVVVWGDYLYAIGGAMGAGFASERGIERARISPDGSLGLWEPSGLLPEVRFQTAAAVVGDELFVMDGWASWSSNNPPWDTIHAHIDADGSIGPWAPVAPTAGRSHAAAAVGSFIYALNDDGSIERSALRPDGALEPWAIVAGTRDNHSYGSIAVLDDTLLAIGGLSGNYPDWRALTSVERAAIGPDGALGPWGPAPSMLWGHAFFSAAVWEGLLYAAGDIPTPGAGSRDVEFARSLANALAGRLYLPLLMAPCPMISETSSTGERPAPCSRARNGAATARPPASACRSRWPARRRSPRGSPRPRGAPPPCPGRW